MDKVKVGMTAVWDMGQGYEGHNRCTHHVYIEHQHPTASLMNKLLSLSNLYSSQYPGLAVYIETEPFLNPCSKSASIC